MFDDAIALTEVQAIELNCESVISLTSTANASRSPIAQSQLPFDQVITLLGLHRDVQGELSLVHALLRYAGHPVQRPSGNLTPFDEVLVMLEQADINPHALEYLRQYMNSGRDAYLRRN